MKLKTKTIKELQEIMKKDYGMSISEEVAADLGSRLLSLSRIAINVTAREMKKKK